jgi:hypothetical protein
MYNVHSSLDDRLVTHVGLGVYPTLRDCPVIGIPKGLGGRERPGVKLASGYLPLRRVYLND